MTDRPISDGYEKSIPILQTVTTLRTARENEMYAAADLAMTESGLKKLRNELALREKTCVAEAYAEERIDGANAQIRSAQEADVIAIDGVRSEILEAIDTGDEELRKIRQEYEIARIERMFYEDLLSAQRALLYASKEKHND